MPYLEQAGEFRGEIVTYAAEEKESGAVAIKIEVLVHEIFESGKYHDWSDHNLIATGRVWVVGRGGKVNKRNAESLMQIAGWDGTFKSIADGSWEPDKVGITVKAEEYPAGSGTMYYKIDWINPFDRNPAGSSGIDEKKSSELDTRFGSQLRGLVRTAKPAKKAAAPSPAVDSEIPF